MPPDPNKFSQHTKDTLAKRAGYICSNPNCGVITSRPHNDDSKAVILGEAAHIKGAKESARYDSNMTPEERRHINNGIWLCCTCHKLIDSDEKKYTVEVLNDWKRHHKELISKGEIKFPVNETYSNIPMRNNYFTGREEILTQLHQILTTQKSTTLVQAITGLGGIGKTQTALEYTYQYRNAYQAIFWVTADTSESLNTGFVAIAELLDLPEKSLPEQSD